MNKNYLDNITFFGKIAEDAHKEYLLTNKHPEKIFEFVADVVVANLLLDLEAKMLIEDSDNYEKYIDQYKQNSVFYKIKKNSSEFKEEIKLIKSMKKAFEKFKNTLKDKKMDDNFGGDVKNN